MAEGWRIVALYLLTVSAYGLAFGWLLFWSDMRRWFAKRRWFNRGRK